MVSVAARFFFYFLPRGMISFTPPTPPPFNGNLVWPGPRMLNWVGNHHIGWPGL